MAGENVLAKVPTAKDLTSEQLRDAADRIFSHGLDMLMALNLTLKDDLFLAQSALRTLSDIRGGITQLAPDPQRVPLPPLQSPYLAPSNDRGNLILRFGRLGAEDEIQIASSGEDALKLALVMLSSKDYLRHGDTLRVQQNRPGFVPDV